MRPWRTIGQSQINPAQLSSASGGGSGALLIIVRWWKESFEELLNAETP